jgi:glucose dehydrogenase
MPSGREGERDMEGNGVVRLSDPIVERRRWQGARVLARSAVAAIAVALIIVPVATAGAAGVGRAAGAEGPRHPAQQVDWSTYGFDLQRTGYNPDESTIGVGNVGGLHVAWSANLGAVTIA